MTTPPAVNTCWPLDTSACADWDSYDQATQDRAEALATSTLRALTAYTIGGCPITVRPCRASCWSPSLYYAYPYGLGGMYPMDVGGQWINIGCSCSADCACNSVCEVKLPPPVGGIESVSIDGTVIPPEWYRVDNNRLLVWQGDPNQPDQSCGWPLCQNMQATPDEVGTFAVTYLNGYPVDAMGAYCAGVLACEYAKAATTGKCRLPPGVTAVTRQGVSYTVNPGTFPGGVTGIPEIDGWLYQVNPNHLSQPPAIWWPGAGTRVTTWSSG